MVAMNGEDRKFDVIVGVLVIDRGIPEPEPNAERVWVTSTAANAEFQKRTCSARDQLDGTGSARDQLDGTKGCTVRALAVEIRFGIRDDFHLHLSLTEAIFTKKLHAAHHRLPRGLIVVKEVTCKKQHVHCMLVRQSEDFLKSVERVVSSDGILLSVAKVDIRCNQNAQDIRLLHAKAIAGVPKRTRWRQTTHKNEREYFL